MPQVEGQEGPAPKGDGSGLGLGGGQGAEKPSGSVSCVFTASVAASGRAPGPLLRCSTVVVGALAGLCLKGREGSGM